MACSDSMGHWSHRVGCLYKPQLHNRKYSKSPSLPLHCALCSFSSILFPAFGAIFGPHKVPGLTMPFVLATWFFLGAFLQFATIDVSNALKPTSPSDFTGPTPVYNGSRGFTASPWASQKSSSRTAGRPELSS